MSRHIMPDYYRPPFGGPLRWQDEVSGELPAAVRAYLNQRIEGAAISPDQLELVRQYVEYYVNAPCWRTFEFREKFARIRADVKVADTPDKLAAVFELCLEVGLDPL